MTQTFSAQVAAQVAEIEEKMDAVFKLAVQATVSEMLEPGPSVATAKKVIGKGVGKVGRGKKRKELFGPIDNPGGTGRLPIDTGFLRASFQMSEGAPTIRNMPERLPDGTYPFDPEPIAFVINGATGDRPLYASFSAEYAAAVEFGSEGRPARAFVRTAAQNWQRNVDAAVAEVKGIRRG